MSIAKVTTVLVTEMQNALITGAKQTLLLLLSFQLLALSSARGQDSQPNQGDSVGKTAVLPEKPISLTSRSPSAREVVLAKGRIQLSQEKHFHVHALIPGRVSKDNVAIGQYVHKGEALALMESSELVRLCSDYLLRLEDMEMRIRQRESSARLAKANQERIKTLVGEGIMASKDLERANEDVRTASEDLEDLNEQQVRLQNESLAITKMYGVGSLNLKQEAAPSELPIKAPVNGIVVEKAVTLGDLVEPNKHVYIIASLDQVNLLVALPINLRRRTEIGQRIEFVSANHSSKKYFGKIDKIHSRKDPLNKYFTVIAVLQNQGELLRPGMVGQAKVFLH